MIAGLPEGTPVLCRSCGGPAALTEHGELRCGHCGAHDQLPGDALGRVLEIKNRLALAASRAAQASAMDGALARVYEDRSAWLRVTGLYLAVALLTMIGGVFTIASAVSQASQVGYGTTVLLAMLPGVFVPPMFIFGGCVAVAAAMGYGRARYRREVRPMLLATPPAYQGAPFRCRACGGDLPGERSVDVTCGYCRTVNLVPAAWHGAQVSALTAEADARRASTHRASAGVITLAKPVRNVLVATWALWTFCLVLLPMWIIPTLSP